MGIKGLNFSNLPHGPAARSPASGLNGRIRVATTFTHVGILYCNSAGFSEKPQESAKIRSELWKDVLMYMNLPESRQSCAQGEQTFPTQFPAAIVQ